MIGLTDAPAKVRRPLRRDRSAGVTVLFAASIIPMLAVVGLAIDFGIWNKVNAELQLAADTAALNAAKVASVGETKLDTNYLAEGVAAGQDWFTSASGGWAYAAGATGGYTTTSVITPTVTVTGTSSITATVSYSGYVPSLLGHLFSVAEYPLYGVSSATVVTSPFLNVEILVDDSSSMLIGASDTDIKTLQELTPCAIPPSTSGVTATSNAGSPGAYYYTSYDPNTSVGNPSQDQFTEPKSAQAYLGFQTTNGTAYGGPLPVPFPTTTTTLGIPYSYADTSSQNGFIGKVFPTFSTGQGIDYANPAFIFTPGPSCQGWLPQQSGLKTPSGQPLAATAQPYPGAGPPCAFACHWDNTKSPGQGNDFLGVARATIGTGYQVTLRFDDVKWATNTVISTMQSDTIAGLNNLNVGIFSFNTSLTKVYPPLNTPCTTSSNTGTQSANEACNGWATAQADVGTPPETSLGGAGVPNAAELGIQPDSQGDTDTDWNDSMTTLLSGAPNYLTAAGTGATAASPKKVLFIVTDGMNDYANGGIGPINTSYCTTFKNMGYTIYVAYTPYEWLMNYNYLANATYGSQITDTVEAALQACSSDPVNDYIVASDASKLKAALVSFLSSALKSPIRFST
jgi:Flp pilus assembly protein TadG